MKPGAGVVVLVTVVDRGKELAKAEVWLLGQSGRRRIGEEILDRRKAFVRATTD